MYIARFQINKFADRDKLETALDQYGQRFDKAVHCRLVYVVEQERVAGCYVVNNVIIDVVNISIILPPVIRVERPVRASPSFSDS